jgi:hypothetical protein
MKPKKKVMSRYNIIWTNVFDGDNDDDDDGGAKIWRTLNETPSSTPKESTKTCGQR